MLKFGGDGARNHAGNVHIGIASAGKTKIDYANDFVVFIEEDIAEIEVAVDEFLLLGLFNKGVVFVDMLDVVTIIELVKEIGKGVFDEFGGFAKVDAGKFLDKLGGVVGDAA